MAADPQSQSAMPPVGTRATCERCGKTVWLRKVAVTGSLSRIPTAKVFGWAARKGSKPAPVICVRSSRFTYRHRPAGYETEYFGPAHQGWEE